MFMYCSMCSENRRAAIEKRAKQLASNARRIMKRQEENYYTDDDYYGSLGNMLPFDENSEGSENYFDDKRMDSRTKDYYYY